MSMMRKKLDKKLLMVLLALAVFVAGFGIAKYAETGGGRVRVDRIQFVTNDGYEMSAKLYIPENATPKTPAPGILGLPGGNASLENLSDVCIELSRRGYVVMAVDPYTIGRSDVVEQKDVGSRSAMAYLKSLDFVDETRLGAVGHSAGSGRAKYAVTTDDEATVVADGMKALMYLGAGSFNLEGINMGVFIGSWDNTYGQGKLSPRDIATAEPFTEQLGTPEIEMGSWYGNVEDGTGRIFYTGNSGHATALILKTPILDTVSFFDTALAPAALEAEGTIYFWKELGTSIAMIGALMMLFPMISFLLERRFFLSIRRPMPEPVSGVNAPFLFYFIVPAVINTLICKWAVYNGQVILGHVKNILRINNTNGFVFWFGCSALLTVVTAVFVTLTIYDPIHKLHSFVGERGETETGKGETELDTVRRIYATTLEKKDNLIQEVEAMAPIVRERFYKNLLMGREFTDSFLEERLHQLGGRLGKEGRYLVFAGGLTEDFPGDTEAVMGTLCQRIGGRAEPFEEPVILEPILMDDASLVLIACLPDEWTDRQIQEWKMETAEQVVALSEQCGAKHSFLISAGGVCQGIQNLPQSYQEAKTDFRYQRYHWDQEEETETGGESYPEILDPAVSGDWKRAYASLGSLLARIRGDLSDEGKTRARYEELISALAEQLLILHATEEKMQLFDPYHRSAQRDDLALLEQVVRETGRQAIDSLGYYGQKSKKRYIRQAREYIEEHSGDSSLSLDLVAEKVGINSAYLSRLFCEICGMNFVSYVNQCRVERAQLLLRQTKIPVKEIGFKTGFNSLQNFNRVFKRHMNMTPGAYRKQEQA